MAQITDVKIPSPGESITEVRLGQWKRGDGDWVEKDELLNEIESDKATLELLAPAAGVLRVKAESGSDQKVGAAVAQIDTAASKPAGQSAARPMGTAAAEAAKSASSEPAHKATPTARKMAEEHGISLAAVQGSGPAGRVTRADVEGAMGKQAQSPAAATAATKTAPTAPMAPAGHASTPGSRGARREKMPKIRQRIAERLLESQQTTATLTTFNEIDMTEVMALRAKHKEAFEKKHGIGLGLMSFFVKAACSALRAYPRVNAFIIGDEIEFHDFCDVAVAVGTDRGLVVPVLRNADTMSFAQIELAVRDFATRARDGKLTVDEMTGGTFTVSNGGVYGSLMATPILNPPQSGILGMHAIKKRAVEDPDHAGQIALRPMMYIALSYDHRIIDGAESVGFLKHIKDCVERPERLLLGL
ncbi:MAG: 2-oxoglutarate dehydrogenase complex dihydrolipoyllysine-residue succinyltransferase [Phycisphaerae bacterium]|nr:2-oxoglutarate dehydrogenase complex dihydrolipoyllysine-residue succinyltransferase [Phycisphaerae bacterium]